MTTPWVDPSQWGRTAAAIIGCTLLTGCVTATVQQVREAATGIEPDQSVVVLGRQHKTSDETEADFVKCVSKNLAGGSNALGVIPATRFRDAMFPWFEPRTAPLNSSDLPEVITRPLLSARLTEIGVRYLIWVEGSTERIGSAGSMTCSLTTAGAGCFGFLSWEDDSSYEALIWDITTGATVGRISSDAVGTSFVPAVVVPIPLIARVRHSACNSLSDQLKVFISAG